MWFVLAPFYFQGRGGSWYWEMVRLHIKKGEESQFLYETTVDVVVGDLITELVRLYNGRLKVDRLCQGEFVCLLSY